MFVILLKVPFNPVVVWFVGYFKLNTENTFFNKAVLKSKKIIKKPDLIIGLNVLAHTPNLKDFISTLDNIMHTNSVAVFEIQYVLNIFKKLQFDTLYHEHYSYFSLSSIHEMLRKTELEIFDIQQIGTHGGSIRVFIKKRKQLNKKEKLKISSFLKKENKIGLTSVNFYKKFKSKLKKLIKKNRDFFISNSSLIIGYGAAAKATIFCNVIGLNSKNIFFIVDKNKYKQNRQIPGTDIDIKPIEFLKKITPQKLLIFPWNLKKEIISECKFLIKKKCKFLTFEPFAKISLK